MGACQAKNAPLLLYRKTFIARTILSKNVIIFLQGAIPDQFILQILQVGVLHNYKANCYSGTLFFLQTFIHTLTLFFRILWNISFSPLRLIKNALISGPLSNFA